MGWVRGALVSLKALFPIVPRPPNPFVSGYMDPSTLLHWKESFRCWFLTNFSKSGGYSSHWDYPLLLLFGLRFLLNLWLKTSNNPSFHFSVQIPMPIGWLYNSMEGRSYNMFVYHHTTLTQMYAHMSVLTAIERSSRLHKTTSLSFCCWLLRVLAVSLGGVREEV